MVFEAILQYLLDAGCDKILIDEITNLLEGDHINEILSILAAHRKTVLKNCHDEQKKIDCIDYLVYKIKKENLL